MNRRFFLQGLGGTAIAAPYLGSVRRFAQAQDLTPKRVVIFHTPQGCITTRWFPSVEDGPLTAQALAGTTIEALAPVSHKLLLPRGLGAVNAFGRTQVFDPHRQAMGSKLTCAPLDLEHSEYFPISHSVDHEIATRVNPTGDGPLVLCPTPVSNDVMLLLSYSAPLTPNSVVADHGQVYRQLTGLFPASPTTDADYRVALGASALDIVREDLLSYRALNMSASDRRRVDDWLDLLRETETGMAAIGGGGSCSTEQASALGVTPEAVEPYPYDPLGFGSVDFATAVTAGGDLMMNLVALSMLCDANRSMVFAYPQFVTFDWDGIHHDYDADGLNHRTGGAAVGGDCVDGVIDMLLEIDVWYASKFTRLVTLFDGLVEGDVSLLDNTATVWLREFSDGGAFNVNNLPVLIAGSAGGYLKQGTAVLLEDEPIGPGNSEVACTEPGAELSGYTGTDATRGLVPINKLYVTLMNAVGCTSADGGPVTEFGVFDGAVVEDGITNPGELTALRA